MNRFRRGTRRDRGQIVLLFALVLSVIVMGVGLVVDGGNALVQRRGAQNASDFAALGGARVIAEWIDGDLVNGTDNNVRIAINNAVAANGGTRGHLRCPEGPALHRQERQPAGLRRDGGHPDRRRRRQGLVRAHAGSPTSWASSA